jgi:hypothetical protein
MTSLTRVITAVAVTLVVCAPVALAAPSASIRGDGTYMVGSDIAPGRYFTSGGIDGEPCYWARLSSLDDPGDFSNVIENSFAAGPQYIDIQPTDEVFKTQFCQPWVKKS